MLDVLTAAVIVATMAVVLGSTVMGITLAVAYLVETLIDRMGNKDGAQSI